MYWRFSNKGLTTLNGSINTASAGDVTILTLTSVDGFPTDGDFVVRIDNELMRVERVATTSKQFSVVRGFDNTTPSAHNDLAIVLEMVSAAIFEDLAQLEDANDGDLYAREGEEIVGKRPLQIIRAGLGTLLRTLKIPFGQQIVTQGRPAVVAALKVMGFVHSPLTTKGDVWGFDSTNNRLPVGSNNQVLTADSTQTLGIKWATPSSSGGGAGNTAFGGRLTLATATPVTTTDQTAKTTIYYALYTHDQVPVTTDAVTFTSTTFTELSLALDSNAGHTGYQQSGKNFDLFLYSDSSTLRLVSGPAWTDDTTRATALTQLKGVWVNSGSMTAKYDASASTLTVADKTGTYLGTMRASANGQCSWIAAPAAAAGGTECKLYLWNMYNRVDVAALCRDSGDSWTYNSATWRSSNNSATNRISYVVGLDEDAIQARYEGFAANPASNYGWVGVGIDSTSSPSGTVVGNNIASVNCYLAGFYVGHPGIGCHFVQAIERVHVGGGANVTFLGDAGAAFIQTGLSFLGRF